MNVTTLNFFTLGIRHCNISNQLNPSKKYLSGAATSIAWLIGVDDLWTKPLAMTAWCVNMTSGNRISNRISWML